MMSARGAGSVASSGLDDAVTERQLLVAAKAALEESVLQPPLESAMSARARLIEPEADRQTLVAFFTAVDPSKLGLVDQILQRYAGKEPTMYETLTSQYGVARTNTHRDSVIKFYERVNPSRICAVDLILHMYEGKEEELMFLLINKYQTHSGLRIWCRYVDSGTGKEYYHNRVTQEVQVREKINRKRNHFISLCLTPRISPSLFFLPQWEMPADGYLVEDGSDVLRAIRATGGSRQRTRFPSNNPSAPAAPAQPAPAPTPATASAVQQSGGGPHVGGFGPLGGDPHARTRHRQQQQQQPADPRTPLGLTSLRWPPTDPSPVLRPPPSPVTLDSTVWGNGGGGGGAGGGFGGGGGVEPHAQQRASRASRSHHHTASQQPFHRRPSALMHAPPARPEKDGDGGTITRRSSGGGGGGAPQPASLQRHRERQDMHYGAPQQQEELPPFEPPVAIPLPHPEAAAYTHHDGSESDVPDYQVPLYPKQPMDTHTATPPRLGTAGTEHAFAPAAAVRRAASSSAAASTLAAGYVPAASRPQSRGPSLHSSVGGGGGGGGGGSPTLVHDTDPSVCEVCHEVCVGFEGLAAHKEAAGHGQWYSCNVEGCPFLYPSQQSLLVHRLHIHKTADGGA